MITELDPTKPAGFYRFGVTFTLNLDGLLSVSVKELSLNKEWTTKFECNVRTAKPFMDEQAAKLAAEMAAGPSANGSSAEAGTTQAPGDLPKPPGVGNLPRPPKPSAVGAPTAAAVSANVAASGAPVASVPSPPADTPEEFKSIARRSFKLVSQMTQSPARDKLLAAYAAFVTAVESHRPESEIQDLGDELGDIYIDSK
jgi:molecular chaperone DnaK